MTNEETVYKAVPVIEDNKKEDTTKAILAIVAVIAVIILIIWLTKRNKGEEVAALCLAEVLPLMEL
jgi:hypothetical protein